MKTAETRKYIYEFIDKILGRRITPKEHDELSPLLVAMAKAENDVNQITIRDLLNQNNNLNQKLARFLSKKTKI